MKIKCTYISDRCYWFTVGKTYDVLFHNHSREFVSVIGDLGDKIEIFLPASAHGKFEVINED